MQPNYKLARTASALSLLFTLVACGSGSSDNDSNDESSEAGNQNSEGATTADTTGQTTQDGGSQSEDGNAEDDNGEDSNGEESNGVEIPGGGGTDGTSPPVVGLVDQFFGNYVSACNPEARRDGAVTITEDSIETIVTVYDDDACTQPAVEQIINYSAFYPGGVTSTELGDAIHVDQTVQTITLNGDVINQFGSNVTFYTIMLLDGVTLYIGIGGQGGDSEADRVTELNTEFVFTRQ